MRFLLVKPAPNCVNRSSSLDPLEELFFSWYTINDVFGSFGHIFVMFSHHKPHSLATDSGNIYWVVYRTNYGLNYVASLLAIKLVLELFRSYPSDEVSAVQNRLRNSTSSPRPNGGATSYQRVVTNRLSSHTRGWSNTPAILTFGPNAQCILTDTPYKLALIQTGLEPCSHV